VRSNDRSVFGGALVVLLGDMRQTLPVVPRAGPAGSIAACIMSWSRWEDVVLLQLATNERVQQRLLRGDSSAGQAARWCAALDNIACARDSADAYVGSATRHYFEEGVRIVTNEDELIDHCYANLATMSDEDLGTTAVLAFHNDTVNELCHKVLRRLPGEEIVLYSADTLDPTAADQLIGVEVLNRVEHPSMPPHQLVVKTGAVLMLMRNLSDRLGMVNGTRLRVETATLLRKLTVRVITPGPHFGEKHFVPRIRFKPDAPDVSVCFTRLQFPVRLAYSMTTNKAQGQTLLRAAIHMKFHAFAHGQLFVACSRVGLALDLAVFCPGQGADDNGRVYTTNVVYPEVLEAFGVGQAQPGFQYDPDNAQGQRSTRGDMHRRPPSPIPQRVRHELPAQNVRSAIERMAHSHADSQQQYQRSVGAALSYIF